jgi:putative membrane protein
MLDTLNMLSYYLLHLLTGFAMLAVFIIAYTRLTPFDEMNLIGRGVSAAALSFGGAIVGFSLTIASSIIHNSSYPLFVVWGLTSMVVQLLAYLVVSRFIPHLEQALEADNIAVGMLTGAIAIAVGLINAGCMS